LEYTTERPVNVDGLQRELDVAFKGTGAAFRIIWGPELNEFNGEIDGQSIIRKKYPDPAMKWRKTVRGYHIVRGDVKVGYETIQGIIYGDDDGLRVPDTLIEQKGLERWIIEQKMKDDIARRQHSKSRVFFANGVKFDLGEFPREGKWGWFYQVEGHDSKEHQDTGFCKVCSCCRHFDELGQMCLGAYREPDRTDLDYVLRCKQKTEQEPTLANPIAQLQRNVNRALDLINTSQQKRDDLLEQEVAKDIELLLRSRMAPTFDMGGARFKSTQLKEKNL
jgi:hypothetical protein